MRRQVTVGEIVEEVARAEPSAPSVPSVPSVPSAASRGPAPKSLFDLGHDHARVLVEAALRRTGGRRAAAAAALGICRVTLWRRIRKYGL